MPELDGDWDGASDDAAVNPPQLKDFEGSSARLYSIGTAGNPSYEAPRMRYMVTGYTRPGELREFDPRTGEDVLLKRANVLGVSTRATMWSDASGCRCATASRCPSRSSGDAIACAGACRCS